LIVYITPSIHAAFPASVIVIAFRLPRFGREVLEVLRAAEAETEIVLRFHGCR
jgi:hypothetical protein